MKLKLVVVDLELTRSQKQLGALVVALAATAAGASIATAEVPVTFTAGQQLTAADLNENFSDLDTSLTALTLTVEDLDPAVAALEVSVDALEAASHPRSAFKAVRTTGAVIPTSVPTPVTFDSEQFDLGGEYNPSNGTFTVAAAGVYHLQCASHLTNGTQAGPIYSMFIIRNGVELQGEDRQASSSSYLSVVASAHAQLSAGDVITCEFFHTLGQNVTLTTGVRTHFSAARVD